MIFAASINKGSMSFSFSVRADRSASNLTVVYLASKASSGLICCVLSLGLLSVVLLDLEPQETSTSAEIAKIRILFMMGYFFQRKQKLLKPIQGMLVQRPVNPYI